LKNVLTCGTPIGLRFEENFASFKNMYPVFLTEHRKVL